MIYVRRLHLYLGIALLPWALLYGVTSFLFNHPTAFSDAPMTTFGRSSTIGTALETVLDPAEMAERIVEALNHSQQPQEPYLLDRSQPARFTREFAFATVAVEGQSISMLLDVANGGGTIRSTAKTHQQPDEVAPFATATKSRPAPAASKIPLKPVEREPASSKPAIVLENPFHERMKSALPSILQRHGFPVGEVTVTSVPEIAFEMLAGGRVWTVIYNPMTGQVSGKQPIATPTPISVRSYLLRLHTAHGYPGSVGARWFWAIFVDVVAAVLLFWSVSGLCMWWQLKSTRRLGVILLLLSILAAAVLAVGMHSTMS
ncbi:hypothetical protein BH10PLA2_BH10PLA2_30270 [soil metagenome]